MISLVSLFANILTAQNLPVMKNVEKDSLYIIYVNLDHKIEINPRKADLSLMELRATNANVLKLNDTVYQVRYHTIDEETKIKLYYKGLPVDIMTAKVSNMLAPKVKIAGISGPNIPATALKGLKKFELVYTPEMEKMKGLEFFNCRILITEPGKPLSFNVNLRNLEFPEQLVSMLSKLKPESTIRFDEFKMKTNQNYVLNVEGSSITFIVVE
jgi:hypothetical protein